MALAVLVLLLNLAGLVLQPARAASRLEEFLQKVPAQELFPAADRFGPVDGNPPAVAAYRGDKLAGYVFLNSDFADATGYSGKPVEILLGMDTAGVVTGARLVEHHEPIFLIGLPQSRLEGFIAGYVGTNALQVQTSTVDRPAQIKVISGATVTVMIISDSIRHAAEALAASRGLAGRAASDPSSAAAMTPVAARAIDPSVVRPEDWTALLADGSVRRLHLGIGQVNDAFAHTGNQAAIARPEPGDPKADFIDLYVALVSVPSIGQELLGPEIYNQLAPALQPGQQALLVAGNGSYSFKGSGYVRGGIFDRIRVLQGSQTIRFRDHDYRRIGELATSGAPHFDEIALFTVPSEARLDPVLPWRLELLVQRQTGPLEKVFLNFDLDYRTPDPYLTAVAPGAPAPSGGSAEPSRATAGTAAVSNGSAAAAIWRQMWRQRLPEIVIMVSALMILTGVMFLQDIIVTRPKWIKRIRNGFLLFTVVWIGIIAHAQLSVVNVVTFTGALIGGGFHWNLFLLEPLIFILWCYVAASSLLWGRGVFCGWLCPFGALQELINEVARALHVPQVTLRWGIHERLWSIKYIVFLVIFGLSLGDMALAERAAEVEPFKTVMVLYFHREWPFVVYAVVLLLASLFMERFFCRYLCPLGAALTWSGRLRMFEWHKRRKECGSCQICANECTVQAIHPEGHINYNECLQCLDCQATYHNDQKCPPLIQRRLKKGRWREASRSAEAPTGTSVQADTAAPISLAALVKARGPRPPIE